VLPKIDLEIEHVLIGAGFRPRVSSALVVIVAP